MKRLTLVIVMLIVTANVAIATSYYRLSVKIRDHNITLSLDGKNFQISGFVSWGHDESVMPIARGSYTIKDQELHLYDSLWGKTTVLTSNKNDGYTISQGGENLREGRFIFQGEDASLYIYGYAMDDWFNRNMARTALQRARRDSILNSPLEHTNAVIKIGAYRDGSYKIELLEGGTYVYTTDSFVIAKGDWSQRGNYIVMKDGPNVYMCEFLDNELYVVYLLLKPHPVSFKPY